MIRKTLKILFWIFLASAVAGAIYGLSLYKDIRRLATFDDAHAADAIIVLGAAQYNGHPSPVLKARLEQAFNLYNRGFAAEIITTGSYGPDPNFSEAHVGTEYLIQLGVDPNVIITDQASGTTRDSIRTAVAMLRSRGWTTALVVSDGFHLFRVKRMLEDEGITAYTSPAPMSPIESDPTKRYWHSLREVVLFIAYRIMNL